MDEENLRNYKVVQLRDVARREKLQYRGLHLYPSKHTGNDIAYRRSARNYTFIVQADSCITN